MHPLSISYNTNRARDFFDRYHGGWPEFLAENCNFGDFQKRCFRKLRGTTIPHGKWNKWLAEKSERWCDGDLVLFGSNWPECFKKSFALIEVKRLPVIFLRFFCNAVLTKRRGRFWKQYDDSKCIFCQKNGTEDALEHWPTCTIFEDDCGRT